ncbi:hypothetical protein [Tenacibaculum sp. M341]|uniref:hypothetical protein n=1 Tax=Tenacibaculum sp. M341 TaxID=2530339 RepID=UPI00104941A4|nr:hypothetical protein [Tenacibaculum sp. M341]TCI90125.1 hypothetical protein EYW44_14405 [Tenacibaculum sp. M341]
MKDSIISFLIYFLFIIGIIGSGHLVIEEIKTANGCPKIMGIPICVIIFICFIIPFFSHLKRRWNILYYTLTGSALAIATIASILQFTNNAECPKSLNGTPKCYFSFLIFLSLILLKFLHSNKKKFKAN